MPAGRSSGRSSGLSSAQSGSVPRPAHSSTSRSTLGASTPKNKPAANGASKQSAPRFRFFDKALFSGISDASPIKCFARESAHKGIYTIAAYGLDTRGILSHMVGAMSLQRLEITGAASKNIRRASGDFFYNEFTADARGAYTDAWFDNLQQFIAAQAKLLYTGEREAARARLIEHIAQDYALGAGEAGSPPVIDIHIAARTGEDYAVGAGEDAATNEQNGRAYEAAVEGKDARYLLYMLSAAFEQQNLSIETFFATTRESHVRDVFMLRSEAGEIDEHTLRINLMLTAQFTYYLRFAANPAKAMERFTELVRGLSETRGEYRDFARQFMDKNSEIASFFAQLLGSGDYLWEDFIRANSAQTMQALYGASAQRGMGLAPSQYASRCAAIADAKIDGNAQETFEEKMLLLNQFKDEQSYLIDLDVLLHHGNSFKELSFRLSELARAVVRCAAGLAYDVLAHAHGHPKTAAGTQAQWVLCGLGKFGGSALGYASDIEIMLIYEDAGDTDGGADGAALGSASNSLSNRDFFSKMVELLQTRLRAKRDGIFQIDARLRPYGDDGPRAVRLDAFIKYYEKNGDAHGAERLALCRMRPVAGSPALAERVQSIRDALIYAPGAIDRREIFALRKDQLAEKSDPRTRNAKFGPGALVDVEYNIQMLQVEHGIAHPKLRQPHLHNAIACLQEVGEISEDERAAMTQAYDFFRALINALRLRRGNASDLTLPPDDSWELEHLARRMDYPSGEISAGRRLCADFDMHSAQVYRFVQKHLGDAAVVSAASGPVALTFAQSFEEARGALDDFTDPRGAFEAIRQCARPQGVPAQEAEEIARMCSRILLLAWPAITRSGEPDRVLRDFSRIAEAAAQPDSLGVRALYEMLLRQPTRLDMLCAVLTGSRHLSEELIKSPRVVSMISDKTVIQKQKDRAEYSAELFAALRGALQETSPDEFSDTFSGLVLKTLREYKNIETLRIISRDICLAAPFEHVVSEISALAASLARAAFAAAVYERAADFGDALQPALEASKRFSEKSIAEIEKHIPVGVAAFGKFGAGELNYSSDLDLLCIYEDRGGMHESLAIALMQRINYYLTKHTEHGKLYRVDMRLRPHGDASPIANSLPFIAGYYKTDAELWELQAALKLGAVAGNLETARACIDAVHERAAARLSALRAKTIIASARAMRVSSRKEHFKRGDDERFEVKNSRGGLRDIEFAVQAMQLLQMRESPRGTIHPDTIGAIRALAGEQIISSEEADAAIRDYLFLRRVEHFLQVYDDRQLHAIPLHDKTIMSRMAYLMTHEPDEDVFIKQLAAIKQRVRAWYDARMSPPLDAEKIPAGPPKETAKKPKKEPAEKPAKKLPGNKKNKTRA